MDLQEPEFLPRRRRRRFLFCMLADCQHVGAVHGPAKHTQGGKDLSLALPASARTSLEGESDRRKLTLVLTLQRHLEGRLAPQRRVPRAPALEPRGEGSRLLNVTANGGEGGEAA